MIGNLFNTSEFFIRAANIGAFCKIIAQTVDLLSPSATSTQNLPRKITRAELDQIFDSEDTGSSYLSLLIKTVSAIGTFFFSFAFFVSIEEFIKRKEIANLDTSYVGVGFVGGIAFSALEFFWYGRESVPAKIIKVCNEVIYLLTLIRTTMSSNEQSKHQKEWLESVFVQLTHWATKTLINPYAKYYEKFIPILEVTNENTQEIETKLQEIKKKSQEKIEELTRVVEERTLEVTHLNEELIKIKEDTEKISKAKQEIDSEKAELKASAHTLKEALNSTSASLLHQGATLTKLTSNLINSIDSESYKIEKPPFLIDVTALDEEVFYLGRELEMQEILDSLYSIDRCNNVIMVGEAGCGKTELVHYIGSRIRKNEVEGFVDWKVYSTTAIDIIAGASYVGSAEKRIKTLFDFLEKSSQPTILFIDEIHQLIGTGQGKNKGIDLSEMLLTRITNPKIRVIGATTPDKLERFQKNKPFKTRFEFIEISPLDRELKKRVLEMHIQKIKDAGVILEGVDNETLFNHLVVNKNTLMRIAIRKLNKIAAKILRRKITASQAFVEVCPEASIC